MARPGPLRSPDKVKNSVMDTRHLGLDTRTGLPDALRVLLAEYPREAWQADPGFGALIRFWLDRHLMFRRIGERLGSECEALLDRQVEDRVFAARLARLGEAFIGELHGHHMIEDAHFFPHLVTLDARVAPGFEILDRDHHAVDGRLSAFASAANAVLGRISEGAAPDAAMPALQDEIARLRHFLDRHLTDEEDLIVPVLLKYQPPGLV